MRKVHAVVLAAFLAVCFLTSPAFAGGKKLPADIQADIKKRFPGAKVLGFTEEPQKHIEVNVELKSGTKVEIIYATKVVSVVKHVFRAEEDQPNNVSVVLLSDGLWKRRFGSDQNIVGKEISVGAKPVTGS